MQRDRLFHAFALGIDLIFQAREHIWGLLHAHLDHPAEVLVTANTGAGVCV
jgi:hypothetical protein